MNILRLSCKGQGPGQNIPILERKDVRAAVGGSRVSNVGINKSGGLRPSPDG